MGRPLKKDILGVDSIAHATGSTGVRVEFYDSALRTDGAIIKQRGAKTFVVAREGDINTTNVKNSTNRSICVLKNGAPSAAGEMRLFGYNPTNSGAEVNISKITKRIATDFSGNKYTWALENDSSNDYIVLTPVA